MTDELLRDDPVVEQVLQVLAPAAAALGQQVDRPGIERGISSLAAGVDPVVVAQRIAGEAARGGIRNIVGVFAYRCRIAAAPPSSSTAPGERQARLDRSAGAHALVRELAGEGAGPCECRPRPTTVSRDGRGVLWCPLCGQIEAGQFEAATEEESA